MKNVLILILFLPVSLFSQVHILKDTVFTIKMREWPHGKEKHIALVLSDGKVITQADDLTLGKGTLPNGDYNFIARPSGSGEIKWKGFSDQKQIKLYDIRVKGDKHTGFKYIVMAEGGFLIQLDQAIASGEIILNPVYPETHNL